MNNEASLITNKSEGAHGVCPHINQQPSRCSVCLRELGGWQARKWHRNTLKPFYDHYLWQTIKTAFDNGEILYMTKVMRDVFIIPHHAAAAMTRNGVAHLCVCVRECKCVCVPPPCYKGCLVKRKCQGGDAWLIRYHGRIMYEQRLQMFTQVERRSKREKRGRQPLFFLSLSLLSSLSLPDASSSSSFFSSSSSFSAASFFFVCVHVRGIFRLLGHITPCFLMQSRHSMGLNHLFIDWLIYLLVYLIQFIASCMMLVLWLCCSIDRLPVMVRFHIPSASCSSTLLIELNA